MNREIRSGQSSSSGCGAYAGHMVWVIRSEDVHDGVHVRECGPELGELLLGIADLSGALRALLAESGY
jgi:hypothetical protein